MVKGDNPLTGPFCIQGAAPGDTLAVKILDLQLDSDQVWGLSHPGLALSVPPTTRPCHERRRLLSARRLPCVFAFTGLIAWMHSGYGLADLDSYELLSKGAKIFDQEETPASEKAMIPTRPSGHPERGEKIRFGSD